MELKATRPAQYSVRQLLLTTKKWIHDKIHAKDTDHHSRAFTEPVSGFLPAAVFQHVFNSGSGTSRQHNGQTMADCKKGDK